MDIIKNKQTGKEEIIWNYQQALDYIKNEISEELVEILQYENPEIEELTEKLEEEYYHEQCNVVNQYINSMQCAANNLQNIVQDMKNAERFSKKQRFKIIERLYSIIDNLDV